MIYPNESFVSTSPLQCPFFQNLKVLSQSPKKLIDIAHNKK